MASINFTFNGESISANVPDNTLLVDFIRETLCKTGTHIGCDTSQCGACVIHINGESVKSCTMLAVMANGQDITSIEGIADVDKMHPMQEGMQPLAWRRPLPREMCKVCRKNGL